MTLEDLSKFALIGVSPDLLSAAGVRRVSDAEARDEFGFRFSAAADLGGIVFPYFHPMTGKRVTARLRRDRPELGPDGKVLNKYISAYGDRRHLFFAWRWKLAGGHDRSSSYRGVRKVITGPDRACRTN